LLLSNTLIVLQQRHLIKGGVAVLGIILQQMNVLFGFNQLTETITATN